MQNLFNRTLQKLQFGTWIINFGELFPKLCHFGGAVVYAHCFEKIGLKNRVLPNFLHFSQKQYCRHNPCFTGTGHN
jgi:hypothetical protein